MTEKNMRTPYALISRHLSLRSQNLSKFGTQFTIVKLEYGLNNCICILKERRKPKAIDFVADIWLKEMGGNVAGTER